MINNSTKILDEKFKNYLDKAISYYISDTEFISIFGRIPKSRYYTFKYCFELTRLNELVPVSAR